MSDVGCWMFDVRCPKFFPSLRSATGGVAVLKLGGRVSVNSLPAEGRSQSDVDYLLLDVGCPMSGVEFEI